MEYTKEDYTFSIVVIIASLIIAAGLAFAGSWYLRQQGITSFQLFLDGGITYAEDYESAVISTDANIRSKPGATKDRTIIGVVEAGEEVDISDMITISTGTEWFYVDCSDQEGNWAEGWVSGKVIDFRYPSEIPITDISASSAQEDFSASYAHDANVYTRWQEAKKGRGVGESLTLNFDKSKVKTIKLVNGDVDSEESYREKSRIAQMEVRFDTGETFIWDLPDRYNYKGEIFILDERIKAESVTLTILKTYKGKSSQTAISEVQLYDNIFSFDEKPE
ncbi:NADase-type glycan-binding domain-containing protein [Zhenpiania hominis]|uniref:NADase-type glycan-binding domain-containing protein n=1 Tax=Zhenpiania hominis TaxID=2763644 RepID=UPI0039F56D2F